MKTFNYWSAFAFLVTYTAFCSLVSICGLILLLEGVLESAGRLSGFLLCMTIVTVGAGIGFSGALCVCEKLGIMDKLNA